ncbi:MAG TPA: DSD1 family PLP-dependent enzyme, partial [Ramlibacter sp.]
LIMVGANQEHGIIAHRSGRVDGALQLPVGTQLRILPNHACSTAAQYQHYLVVGAGGTVTATWPRINGWSA